MVTEEQKYLASVFKILGFAFMTPFGSFMLNIRNEIANFSFWFFIYLIFVLFLVYIGMILLDKGHLWSIEKKRHGEWK